MLYSYIWKALCEFSYECKVGARRSYYRFSRICNVCHVSVNAGRLRWEGGETPGEAFMKGLVNPDGCKEAN